MSLAKSALNRSIMLAQGARLAEELNREHSDERLIAQLEALQSRLDRVKARDFRGWHHWTTDKTTIGLVKKVNLILCPHGWHISPFVWEINTSRRAPWQPTIPLREKDVQKPGSGSWFGYALRDVVEDRTLTRVRLCPVCHQWFFARKADQKNCSKICRNKCGVHASPEQWRAYMRVRMRIDRKLGKIRSELELLKPRMDEAPPAERKQLSAQVARLEVEQKSLFEKKKGAKRYAKN